MEGELNSVKATTKDIAKDIALVRFLKKAPNKRNLKDPNITATEQELTDKIGMKVLLNSKKNNSGTLTFEYKEIDQLNKIIEILKSNY